MSTLKLNGRVAIITGASRGIGKALAETFAARGAAVVVAARSEQVWNERLPGTIHDTAAAIVEAGGRATAVRCDATVDEDLVHLVDVAVAEFGPVDILVNNAAVTVPGRPPTPSGATSSDSQRQAKQRAASGSVSPPRASTRQYGVGFLDFPLKGFRLHYEVNLFAAYRLMQLVLPGMLELGRGSILNITSDASRRPGEGPYEHPGHTTTFAYGGSKAALEHLTRSVAFEVQPHGVAVNALMPSLPVATPGMLFMGSELAEEVTMESFCDAALRVICEPADRTTGQILYSEDVLHPELGRRGWLGAR